MLIKNKQKNITLVAIDFKTHDLTRRAIEICLSKADVGDVVVISDQDLIPGSRWIQREPTANFPEYSNIMLKGVAEHVNTSHAVYVQYDGMIWDPGYWNDKFMNYDYIGAVWPWEPEGRNVGNGGFCLRSKKMLEACLDEQIQISAERNFIAEDASICIDHRPYLENKYDIKFAPSHMARQFSHEVERSDSWGWHGLWHVFGYLDLADVEYYSERLTYKGWNIYLWHHVLATMAARGLQDELNKAIPILKQDKPELVPDLLKWFLSEDFPNQPYLIWQLKAD
jgi:hypothetical protein